MFDTGRNMHKSEYLRENRLDYNMQITTRNITALTVPKIVSLVHKFI